MLDGDVSPLVHQALSGSLGRSRWRSRQLALPLLVLVVALLAHSTPALNDAPPQCGNGVVEGDEECDDGGICIGSPNAGISCTHPTQCPGGQCKTFGGHGCAANCTLEHDVAFNLLPGQADFDRPLTLQAGTSGAVVHGEIVTLPLPLDNGCVGGSNDRQPCTLDADCPAGGVCRPASMTLSIGKDRGDGLIPVAVNASSVRFPRIDVGGLACACIRGVAGKTCGGTFFEPDGVTQSPDCTQDDSVCAGKNPCTSVNGEGNSASGVIGCNGLDGVNFVFVPDCTGQHAPTIRFTGADGPGSAVLFSGTAIGMAIDGCSGSDVSVYGPDGEFCTDDDPAAARGASTIAPFVTGTATAQPCDTGVQGLGEGPAVLSQCCPGPICLFELPPCPSVTGRPFSCTELARGSVAGTCLASAFADRSVATTVLLCAQAEPEGTPPVTATPTPTSAPDECLGDCDGDAIVTISELITGVNILLGSLPPSACPALVCNTPLVLIDCLIGAVNNALNGCPNRAAFCGGIAGLPCAPNQVCDLRDETCSIVDLGGMCVDKPDFCLDIFSPVCGCDRVTYPNDCERRRSGATLAHEGICGL